MSSKFLEKQETPTWIDQMFDEIDTLEFGAGFEHLQNDAQMQFGAAEIKGVEAIKMFFVKIDSPLEIKASSPGSMGRGRHQDRPWKRNLSQEGIFGCHGYCPVHSDIHHLPGTG